MNVLVASSRQYTPEHEWIFLGIRNLMEGLTPKKLNWALYDKNPDLLRTDGQKTHRTKLESNSFRHETLLPFSAVVLAGTSQWHGREMELLFGCLTKSEVPLLALGMEMPEQPVHFSPAELVCFSRPHNVITAKDRATLQWLQRYDLNAQLLPCPTLFASKHGGLARPQLQSGNLKIAAILQHSQRPGARLNETTLRKLCQSVTRLSQDATVDVIAPTMDDFMRFSALFPEQIKYSYEASDYLELMENSDVVVTSSPGFAILANSLLKPAVLVVDSLGEAKAAPTPFISLTETCNIRENIESALKNKNFVNECLFWKEEIRRQWVQLLNIDPIKVSANQ